MDNNNNKKNGTIDLNRHLNNGKVNNEEQEQPNDEDTTMPKQIPILGFLKYATRFDYVLVTLGFLTAMVTGLGWPVLNILFGLVVDIFVQYEKDYALYEHHPEELDPIREEFMGKVYIISGTMFITTVVYIAANYVTIYCFQLFALRQISEMKRRYFQSILRQEVAWYDRSNSGEYASRIGSDFKKIEAGINENLALLIFNLSLSPVSLVIGLIYGWKLSLVIISLTPILGLSAYLMTKFQSIYTQRELTAYSAASSVAEEVICAIRTVFAFGGEKKEENRYRRMLIPAMKNSIARNIVTALSNSVNWAVLYCNFALGLWYGVRLIVDETEHYTIGDVVTVFWSISCVGFSIGYAAPYFESFQIARTTAAGIINLIERQSEIDPNSTDGQSMLNNSYRTDIQFKNVHFSYPTRPEVPILRGINLNINSGEIVALVGSSGCGKSTIIQLIQRFYDPNDGEVCLDGKDIRDLNLGWLREQIGVVGQEPILFDASIEDNIRLGVHSDRNDKDVPFEHVVRAAIEANAHEFIQSLPNGYGTRVGDRGTALSGGQKQRIAIARALISQPKILLLDEATSALDIQSESIVQTALDRAARGRTTIIIAHRLSTIINADRIILLESGTVKEVGTHQQLMERRSAYYRLVQAQQVGTQQSKMIMKHNVMVESNINQHNSKKNSIGKSFRSKRGSTLGSTRISMLDANGVMGSDIDSINQPTKLELIEAEQASFPYWRVGKIIWDDKFYFGIAILCALLFGLVTPIYAYIFGAFVDEFSIDRPSSELESVTLKYSYYYLAVAASIFISQSVQISLFGLVGEHLTLRLRTEVFSSILRQEISWFDQPTNSAGAICARLANDAANVQGATGLRIAMICQALSTLVCSILVGFILNWQLALGGLVLMPIIGGAGVVSAKLYTGQAKQDGQTAEQSSSIMIEVLNAVRTVVSLHKQDYFYRKFTDSIEIHFNAIYGKLSLKALFISIALGAPFFAYSISFIYGGFLLSRGLVSSGDFFKIIESMVFGAMVIGQTAILSADFTKAKLAAINIYRLIDSAPKPLPNDDDDGDVMVEVDINGNAQQQSKRSSGNIAFRGVHFNYPTRPDTIILNGLSFSADRGETVALVGSSGSGKSTTIQLLEQFYQCSNGQILLDKQPLTDRSRRWVRSQISMVSQEPILFGCSIAENIAYGDNSRRVPFEEIVRAAQAANVHDFICSLPNSYETPVGSKGTQLSGGQKQRIAIARALVRDPPILLLDEATSALDTESEKIVQSALDEASKGRTCIVIAHRLKTIVNADKIVVIDRGQNVEEGTHHELLNREGFYCRLYNSGTATDTNDDDECNKETKMK